MRNWRLSPPAKGRTWEGAPQPNFQIPKAFDDILPTTSWEMLSQNQIPNPQEPTVGATMYALSAAAIHMFGVIYYAETAS